MGEALLVAPLLGSFTIVEFVMTMGANDFKSFIISYFISYTVTMMNRIFIGPLVEKLEALTQRGIIWLSSKSKTIRYIFKDMLIQ